MLVCTRPLEAGSNDGAVPPRGKGVLQGVVVVGRNPFRLICELLEILEAQADGTWHPGRLCRDPGDHAPQDGHPLGRRARPAIVVRRGIDLWRKFSLNSVEFLLNSNEFLLIFNEF